MTIRSVKKPCSHLVGSFKVIWFFHYAAWYICISCHVCFFCPETSCGKALKVGVNHLGIDINRAESSKEISCNLLVLSAGHGEIALGKVHEGVGSVQESLELSRELIPVNWGKNQHGIA